MRRGNGGVGRQRPAEGGGAGGEGEAPEAAPAAVWMEADGRKYTHGLHPTQMEALRAMCGAFIPSLRIQIYNIL